MKKRVKIVTVRLMKMELVKEGSILYQSRDGSRMINCPGDIFSLVQDIFNGLDRELIIALYLNTKNEPIAMSKISLGNLNVALFHPREVMKAAILSNAASLVLCHNHPSGNTNPSEEDILITKRLTKVGEIVGIELLDHIIIGLQGNYISLKEKNNL